MARVQYDLFVAGRIDVSVDRCVFYVSVWIKVFHICRC